MEKERIEDIKITDRTKFPTYLVGSALGFTVPHIASIGSGLLKAISDLGGYGSVGAETTIPILAGSAIYRGVAKGAYTAWRNSQIGNPPSREEVIRKGSKGAGLGAIIFPLEFSAAYLLTYGAVKIFN